MRWAAWLCCLAAAAAALAPGAARADFVCTQMLRAKFSSMFISQDIPQVALDTARLCETCEKISRLALVLVTRDDTRQAWAQALRDSACTYAERHYEGDCGVLLDALVSQEANYFSSDKARLSVAETADSLVMALALQARARQLCVEVMCCPHSNSTLGEGANPGGVAGAPAAASAKTLVRSLLQGSLAPLAADVAAAGAGAGAEAGAAAPAAPAGAAPGQQAQAPTPEQRSIHANRSADEAAERLAADRERLDQEKRVFDHKAAYLENYKAKLDARAEELRVGMESVEHEKKLIASGVVKADMEHKLAVAEKERAVREARREEERREENEMAKKQAMREDEIEAEVKKVEAKATDAEEGRRKGAEVRARMVMERNKKYMDQLQERKEKREAEEKKEKEEADEKAKKEAAQVQATNSTAPAAPAAVPAFREDLAATDEDDSDDGADQQ